MIKIGLFLNEGVYSIADMTRPNDPLVEIRFTGDWRRNPADWKGKLATVMFRAVESVGTPAPKTSTEGNNRTKLEGGS